MTAEIAVLNRWGVAMAADSAVTIGNKIYNTAIKLFALSKYHPVGVMIYGDAAFMQLPWQTVIKEYRARRGTKGFAALDEYCNDFISFLRDGKLISEKEQRIYVDAHLAGIFKKLLRDIQDAARDRIENTGAISDKGTEEVVHSTLLTFIEQWRKEDDIADMSRTFRADFIERYRAQIESIVAQVFQRLPISRALIDELIDVSALVFSKKRFPSSVSGVVVAGFGEDEMYPSVADFRVQCIVDGLLKYERKNDSLQTIGEKQSSLIRAFAQREMVFTFIEGVDPDLLDFAQNYLTKVFDEYPDIMIRELRISGKNKAERVARVKEQSKTLLSKVLRDIGTYRVERHVRRVVEMASYLPLDELAAMAEALVNLTSFKRRVTPDAETVGGPIDVAVISKGDGLVWIRRKHYFRPELNYHFFQNYFREGGRDEQTTA